MLLGLCYYFNVLASPVYSLLGAGGVDANNLLATLQIPCRMMMWILVEVLAPF